MASQLRGGIDLGGTKIQAIVVDEAHQVIGQARRPTPISGGPPDVLAALADALRGAAGDADVEPRALIGVGVGAPGRVDARAGTVANASNLPGWTNAVDVTGALGADLGTPVVVGNDVQVATNAERTLGAARDVSSLLGVFWGTGVGGGIVLNGRPWLGRGSAGEIGHVVVERDGRRCGCGRRGCMEAYAGRRSMEARARKLHDEGEKTELFHIMKDKHRERLTSGVWAKAFEDGDPLAVKLLDEAVAALGVGVASVCNVLDVEQVVIGGGLGVRFGAPFVVRIREAMMPHLFVDDAPPQITVAGLGDLGGALGAALLVEAAA
jgi:glucokinase